MKHGSRFLLTLLILWITGANAAEFSQTLDNQLAAAKAGDFVSAIIILESPIDIMNLDFQLHARKATLAERHQEVLAALKYNAAQTQPALQAELDAAKSAGILRGYTAYWIENLFVVSATPDFLESLRNRGDIKYVTENIRPELIEPIMTEGRQPDRNPLDTEFTTPGQDAIRATEVNTSLGITGNGTLVANLDTGVDGTHPALASRWRGNTEPWQECWRDMLGGGTTFPEDNNGHGTHTMGTMCGREFEGDGDINTVGSAPNAQWIAHNAVGGFGGDFDSDIIDAFQWFADPDGNAGTLDDVPDVIQNSWGVNTGLGYVQCFDFWNTVITNCEAAGPVITWSAGNEDVSGLRSPAIYSLNAYQIFSVGAVDATNFGWPYPLASFSSQGPTPCGTPLPDNIKPEISAPGVDVYSSVPGGGYNGFYSGTSMAGPHVAGVVALMREACPDCDHITIKDAIMLTAHDLGAVGQDNQYGHGFIDAFDAVVAVSTLGEVCGVVTDASNAPIEGARIGITTGANQVFTAADGSFCLPLSEGSYTVECSSFGYITQFSGSLSIVEGQTTTQNFTLVAAPSGTVSGIVTDCAGGPAIGATVTVLNTPVAPDVTDGTGFYSITLPQGTYDMSASGVGCAPHDVSGVAIGASTTQDFTLLSDPRFECSVPDPYGYTMCEDVDAGGHALSWQAITPLEAGPGTPVLSSVDDGCEGPFPVPFPIQFYGTSYPEFYIGSNGYVTFGACAWDYFNQCFPQDFMPAGLYINWNDMTTYSGEVAYYYDAANHWLVVSWYQISYYSGAGQASYQIIIYDQGFYSSATGDNHILFQYDSPLGQTDIATVGIKTETGPNFSMYECDGVDEANAWGQEPGRTIYFSTGPGCDVGDADITVTPSSLDGAAPLGGTDTGSLEICNVGLCPLYWNIDWNQSTPALALSSYVPTRGMSMTKQQIDLISAINRGEKPVIATERRNGSEQLDAQGGPDAFGYRWIDSDEPSGPVFNWFEINGIGTNTGMTFDDEVTSVGLPFGFDFYGITYNTVNISSNGNVHFGGANAAYSNTTLPDAFAPSAMVAAFWDDLYLPTAGQVYYYDDVANNRFVVEWDGIAHIAEPLDVYTFQILLYANGRIVTQYATQQANGSYGLTSCTIGLNNETGTTGLEVVFDAAYLHDNMAIEFKATTDWLTITPPAGGVLDPGQCTNVGVTFEAGELPAGTYTGDLQVQSNDPDESPVTVPVTFVVGSYPAPINLTIVYLPGTNQLRFDWVGVGAPQYQVWSATDSDGPYNVLVGTTAATTLTVAHPGVARTFYHVVASN